MPDSEYDPHPAVEVAWLVSGNEGYEKKLAVLMGSGSFASRKDYIEIPDAIEKDQRYFIGSQSSCLLYTSPSPRDAHESRMPSSA